jgi:hypothetical protein
MRENSFEIIEKNKAVEFTTDVGKNAVVLKN